MTTTSDATRLRLSDVEHSAQLRRAVVAGTVGTIIEAYDFLLYVQVAPLVFAKLFFPHSDPLVGTMRRLASTPWASYRARSEPRCSAITATASAAR